MSEGRGAVQWRLDSYAALAGNPMVADVANQIVELDRGRPDLTSKLQVREGEIQDAHRKGDDFAFALALTEMRKVIEECAEWLTARRAA